MNRNSAWHDETSSTLLRYLAQREQLAPALLLISSYRPFVFVFSQVLQIVSPLLALLELPTPLRQDAQAKQQVVSSCAEKPTATAHQPPEGYKPLRTDAGEGT